MADATPHSCRQALSTQPGRGRIYDSITDTIGDTPLVRLDRLAKDAGRQGRPPRQARILQPDRQRQGPHRRRHDRALEAAGRDQARQHDADRADLAATPASRSPSSPRRAGYRLILVMPETMSLERRKMLALLGAELVLTAGAEGHEGRHRQGRGDRRARRPDAVIPQQFENPANPEIHRRTTAEEIWNDTDGEVDVVVSGVGTGGTITGVGQVLKPRKPSRADHRGRARGYRRCCPAAQPGPHKIQGIGAGFVPTILDTLGHRRGGDGRQRDRVRHGARWRRVEGIPVGISSGAAIAAALEVGAAAGDGRQEHRHHHPLLRRALSVDGAVRRAVGARDGGRRRKRWPAPAPAGYTTPSRRFGLPRDPAALLRTVFGHDSFRGLQEEAVRHIAGGGDGVVVFPTGGGKSLCYQLPALCREGTGIVVSPLIALMRDQVEALRQLGVSAAALNSAMAPAAAAETRRALRRRHARPPLRHAGAAADATASSACSAGAGSRCSPSTRRIASSQWGHDFRPGISAARLLRRAFPGVPRVALTATADPQTREDISARLGAQRRAHLRASFDRPNIRYAIVEKDEPAHASSRSSSTAHAGEAGIVYCLSRAKVDETSPPGSPGGGRRAALPRRARPGRRAHADQERFLREDGVVMVATIAFGMGIDKPDVRFVAHLDLPKTRSRPITRRPAAPGATACRPRRGWPTAWPTSSSAPHDRRGRGAGRGQADRARASSMRCSASARPPAAGARRCSPISARPSRPCGNCDTCLRRRRDVGRHRSRRRRRCRRSTAPASASAPRTSSTCCAAATPRRSRGRPRQAADLRRRQRPRPRAVALGVPPARRGRKSSSSTTKPMGR